MTAGRGVTAPDKSTNPGSAPTYKPEYFAPLFAAEARHFWFNARNRLITTLALQITAHLPAGYRVLEVGCGTGNVLHALENVCDQGSVIGMDLFIEGLRFARRRTQCALVQGDMHAPPFRVPFDVICLFDVLEHLPDDLRVLHDIQGMLAPGGVLFLTVPAHMSLWSHMDEAGHHCRRYECDELEHKLREAGYEVEYLTLFMALLFPVMWLSRRLTHLLNRRKMREDARLSALVADELRVVPVLNGLLSWILGREARLVARRRRIVAGTSLLAIGRKTV